MEGHRYGPLLPTRHDDDDDDDDSSIDANDKFYWTTASSLMK